MANRYYETQKMYNNGQFVFNSLNGYNEAGSAQSKITIKGHLDDFSIETLYSNYDQIAHNLKVYPTITIYPRGYELKGDMGGFYHPQYNHIEMVDHWYLITILSHEMRHAFQFIYFPDLYYATEYRSVRGYLNSEIERDARGYSLDYCIAKGYKYAEEAAYNREHEEKIELVLQNRLSPSVLELSETYFSSNPVVAYSVPRNYHWQNYNQSYDQDYDQGYAQSNVVYMERKSLWGKLVDGFYTLIGCAGLLFIVLIILGLVIYLI
ncbi:hypothetical protein [Priestia flexa]|uniref:hypothetical protein n=1 Tax=Priestia flexa TaxID=86664 RepID=UPI003D070705